MEAPAVEAVPERAMAQAAAAVPADNQGRELVIVRAADLALEVGMDQEAVSGRAVDRAPGLTGANRGLEVQRVIARAVVEAPPVKGLRLVVGLAAGVEADMVLVGPAVVLPREVEEAAGAGPTTEGPLPLSLMVLYSMIEQPSPRAPSIVTLQNQDRPFLSKRTAFRETCPQRDRRLPGKHRPAEWMRL
jgi:hypothetical protein